MSESIIPRWFIGGPCEPSYRNIEFLLKMLASWRTGKNRGRVRWRWLESGLGTGADAQLTWIWWDGGALGDRGGALGVTAEHWGSWQDSSPTSGALRAALTGEYRRFRAPVAASLTEAVSSGH